MKLFELEHHLRKGGKVCRGDQRRDADKIISGKYICLKNGEFVYDDNEDSYVVFDESVFADDWEVYEEPKKAINIRKTTVYKTRDGRKAFIGGLHYGIAWGLIENNTSITMWDIKTGKVFSDKESEVDIVSEWED